MTMTRYERKLETEQWRWSLKVVHWIMALLIFSMIGLGWLMTTWKPDVQTSFTLYQSHKSLGLIVFIFLAARIILRLQYGAPPPPVATPTYERVLASVVHATLYILMAAMPISGWLIGSFSGFPTEPFGLFILPDLFSPDPHRYEIVRRMHELLSFFLVAALLLHVIGALKHHFWDRDNILKRMLPTRRS